MLALPLLATSAARAQQVKLRATLQVPVAQPFYGASLVRLKEEVEKASNNAITIEIFDKGRLFNDTQVVDAVASGAVDIGTTATHQYARKVPAVGIINLPFLFNFRALVNAAVAPGSEIRKLLDHAILTQLGVRVLWWQGIGESVFYSKGQDYADPGRLKDQRIAVPGKALEELIWRCGGKPSAMGIETFESAIRAGALDGAGMITVGSARNFGLVNVTDTITFTADSPVEFILVINEKRWRSLPPWYRHLIAEAARKVEREAREHMPEVLAKFTAFVTGKGMRIKTLTPDQVADWRACSAEMLGNFMEQNGELARKLMAAYAKLRTDPCCTEAPSTAAFTRR
jgi:TRAP-type C4-dicarboxylate transport system substrate-binding protein